MVYSTGIPLPSSILQSSVLTSPIIQPFLRNDFLDNYVHRFLLPRDHPFDPDCVGKARHQAILIRRNVTASIS